MNTAGGFNLKELQCNMFSFDSIYSGENCQSKSGQWCLGGHCLCLTTMLP